MAIRVKAGLTFQSKHHRHISFKRITLVVGIHFSRYLEENSIEYDFKIIKMEDVFWGGDMVVEITLECSNGEWVVLIAHFPPLRSKHAIRAAAFMASEAIQNGIGAPIPLTNRHLENDCIIYIKPPGESLYTLWPRLSKKQRKTIIRTLAEDIVALSDITSDSIRSYTPCSIDPHMPSFFFSRAFEHSALSDVELPPAFETTEEYLESLADRILFLFDEKRVNNPWTLVYPGKPTLTDQEKANIRKTWTRLYSLIPHYTGGQFMAEHHIAREVLETMVASHETFGITHTDLRMSRIIVQLDERGQLTGRPVYTGWEYAHTAPKWSCARLPRWLTPNTQRTDVTPSPLTREEKGRMSRVFLGRIQEKVNECDQPSAVWMLSFAFGYQERFFEDLLSCHWMFRDTVEHGIKLLQDWWEALIPEEPFPLSLEEGKAQSSSSALEARLTTNPKFTFKLPPFTFTFECPKIEDCANTSESKSDTSPELDITIPLDDDEDASSLALTVEEVGNLLQTLGNSVSVQPTIDSPLSPPPDATLITETLVSPLLGGGAFTKARAYIQGKFSKMMTRKSHE